MAKNDKSDEILKKVRRIEISTRKTIDTMLSGQYHTRFRGQGMQFSEFREYAAGDDIRHIDWKVTARTQSTHIKKFEEERDLTITLILDVSASGFFGSKQKMKTEALAEVLALISFAAVKNNDRVGLILFSDRVLKHIPPKKGLSHAMRLIADILHTEPQPGKTNLKEALEFFSNGTKQTGIAFIASDFYADNYEKILRKVGRKHDVIALRMIDPSEKAVPKVGWIDMMDAETGERFSVNTATTSFQQNFEKERLKFEAELNSNFTKAGMDRLDLYTNEDYFSKVVGFFKNRRKRKTIK